MTNTLKSRHRAPDYIDLVEDEIAATGRIPNYDLAAYRAAWDVRDRSAGRHISALLIAWCVVVALLIIGVLR